MGGNQQLSVSPSQRTVDSGPEDSSEHSEDNAEHWPFGFFGPHGLSFNDLNVCVCMYEGERGRNEQQLG